MRHIRLLALAGILAALNGVQGASSRAEIPAERRDDLKAIEKKVARLAGLIKTKKLEEAEKLLAEVNAELAPLKEAEPKAELEPLIAKIEARVAAARNLIDGKKPGGAGAKKPAGEKGKLEPDGFTKGVAPILVGRCANCHIQNSRGGFSVSNYPAILKGSNDGVVFQPGKSKGSRLMDVLESGDMPRGGGRLSDEELATIAKWIDAGAKFDGPDETTPLTTLVGPGGGTPAPTRPMLTTVKATGKEKIQFMRDVAPLLLTHCVECHGGQQPAGRLTLTTFASILAGSRDGPIVAPGQPATSLLIAKLRGTATRGARMPFQRDPLPEEEIAKFETWISEGAKFDGEDPAQSLDLAMRIMIAKKMTHEELTAQRRKLAKKNWQLAIPGSKIEPLVVDDISVIGALTPAALREVADAAKAERAKVAAYFKIPAGKPLLKGGLTLFAFGKRFDYSEFGSMVEKRSLPGEWRAHWKYDILDAYVCVVPPKPEAGGLDLALAEQISGLYLDSLGRVPRWFSAGAARAIAAKIESKDPTIKTWDEELDQAMSAAKSADEFLASQTPTGQSLALSYGMARFLMTKPGKFQSLLDQTRKGIEFDKALAKAYGGDAKTIAGAWARVAGQGK